MPRAILFEPDRRNRVHLGANLLINDLLEANLEIHPLALGAEPGRFRLVPGPERDIGLSQIVETAQDGQGQGYDVEVVRFDDFVALTGQTLAIKIDVERYERKVLAGMARTLRDNRGIVQIEVLEAREETSTHDRRGIPAGAGFRSQSRFQKRLRSLSRELLQFADNGRAHLRGADDFGAFGFDIRRAQPLGQYRGDRGIERIGRFRHIEGIP